jgi:sodium/proline symporter
MKVQVLIPFLAYLFLLILGILYYRQNVSGGMSGFFLGDKKVNRFVIAISSVVSARGAWLLLGITAQAYIMGLSAFWLIAGLILSETLLFFFIVPRMRSYSEKYDCLTLTDLIISHFQEEKKSLRQAVTAALLLFTICFISSQFLAGGLAFYAMLGLTLTNGIILTAVIVLLFVFLGGFKVLNYTDVFQTLIILTVLISIPIIILIRKEGFQNLHSEIVAVSPGFFNLNALSFGTLAGFLSVGLGSPGNPNILVRIISMRGPDHFRWITGVNFLTNIMMASGALCTGIFAKAYFPVYDSIPGGDPQNVFIGIAGVVLIPVILGAVLIAILGAVISSSGSQVLVSSSAIVSDFFEKVIHKGAPSSQAKLTFYSRIAIIILVYICILVAIFIDTDLYRLMIFSFAGLGASLGPAVLFSLFWKESTGRGILAGVITGSLTVILWKSIPFLSDHLYEFIPGFFLAAASIWIGSKIDKRYGNRKSKSVKSFTNVNKN